MKKNCLLLLMLLGCSFWVSSAFAQHDNLTNVSADFMRMGGRTAALGAADIAVYNPAGLVHLDDGLHINLANQFIFRSPTHSFTIPIPPFNTPKEYTQDSPDLLLPNIYLAYKRSNYSLYGGFYISGGGGSIDYPEGSINSDLIILQLMDPGATSSILGSSFYMTPFIGLSYGITEKLSAAVSFKYILATNKQEAFVNTSPGVELGLESTDKANGMGFTGSLNYKASDNFNIAARYETKASLEFETEVMRDDFGLLVDGALNHRDLPAAASLGATFNITENLSGMVEGSYYFQKQADWGVDRNPATMTGREWSEVAGDAARVGVGLGYDIGDILTVNGWWGYTMYQYADDADMALYYTRLGVFETIKDNNWSAGLGVQLNVSEKLNINAAFVQSSWAKDQVITEAIPVIMLPYDVTYNNSISSFALGLNILLGGE